jgi:hypothetical protein
MILRALHPDDVESVADKTLAILITLPEYAGVILDRAHVVRHLHYLIELPNVFFMNLWDGDELVGNFCGAVHDTWFSPTITASELFFWLHEDYRTLKNVFKLLRMWESFATMHSATSICMGASTGVNTDRVAKLYEHLGYMQVGTQHTKRI